MVFQIEINNDIKWCRRQTFKFKQQTRMPESIKHFLNFQKYSRTVLLFLQGIKNKINYSVALLWRSMPMSKAELMSWDYISGYNIGSSLLANSFSNM